MNLTIGDTGDAVPYEAINTTCSSKCTYLWVFIVLAFCNMLITFLCTMPALSATLRVVRDDQRSFALGIQWIKVRILGTIPAPMVFGALIDDTCILWNETCEGRGACLVYDNYYMSRLEFTRCFDLSTPCAYVWCVCVILYILYKCVCVCVRRYMLALAFIGKAASLLFFFLAWWTYVPPKSRDEDQNSRQRATLMRLSDTSQEAQIVVPTTIT